MKEDPPEAATTDTCHLAAIMFTDIVGFSRQMGANEAHTLRLLAVHNQVIEQAVTAHQGYVIKTFGDAFLVDFPSVVRAVQCAQHIQTQFRTHNAEKEKGEQIHVRIGIHLGDIIVQPNGDVLGDGVNIASRLQTLAEPDTIYISHKVYEEVEKKLTLGTVVSLGRPKLKNITPRFPIYALLSEPPKGLWQALQIQRLKLSRRVGTAHRVVAMVLLLVGAGVLERYFHLFPFPGQPQGVAPTGSQTALPLPDKPSIVVLPFVNMSGDPAQEYFSDGMTESLTTDLSRISSLFVIARNSAFTYKGKAVKVQDVSKEMGVRYVLEGSVQKADNRVRINAQLVDALTGHHLWSERYDRDLKDLFALQDELGQKIVLALKVKLTPEEQERFTRYPTANLEAYEYVLRGVELHNRFTKETNAQARQMFEKALALDPQYAGAYAWLGWTYWLDWVLYWNHDPQNLERAWELAQRARDLDDSIPDAHQLLSWLYLWEKKQPEQALAEAERALALDLNYADSYQILASVLSFVGRPEEAIGVAEKAIRLDPHAPNTASYLYLLGNAYQLTGRPAEAIAAQKQALVHNPDFQYAYTNLAFSYVLQWAWQLSQDPQTLEQALAAAQQAIALNDSFPWAHTALGSVYLWQKQHKQALTEAERAIALDPNLADGYATLAGILNAVGKPEEAIGVAEKAVRLFPNPLYLFELGHAYCLSGRHEEAITTLKQLISRYPNRLDIHLMLAAVYSELGQGAEARAEAAEVLRLNPQFSLEVHRQRMPIKDPAVLERHLAALRKAGLK